jgi:hypothetical protein
MGDMIEVCWADSPAFRPSFKEVMDFLANEVVEEVMGEGGASADGTGRRQSSIGGGVAGKVEKKKLEKMGAVGGAAGGADVGVDALMKDLQGALEGDGASAKEQALNVVKQIQQKVDSKFGGA